MERNLLTYQTTDFLFSPSLKLISVVQKISVAEKCLLKRNSKGPIFCDFLKRLLKNDLINSVS